MSDYDFILDSMCWSYSSLEAFHNCKYGFFLNYIDRVKNSSGAFSEYGSLCHKLLENYLKGNLLSFELADKFEANYKDKVSDTFPPIRGNERLYDRYYDAGYAYFSDTDKIEQLTNNNTILGIEDKHYFYIDKYKFVGILDVEAKNNNGEFEIIDHKTKSRLDKKRLTKKHNKEDWLQLTDERYVPRDLFNQQYLYCIPFKEQFGEYPTYLNLNMLRIGDWYKIKFNKEDFDKAVQWALDTLHDIYNETEWAATCKENQFFCDFLCSQANFCKYCSKYIGEK